MQKNRTVNDFRGAGLDGESGEGWGQKLGGCVETGEGRGQSAGEGGGCCWSCGGKGRCPVPSGEGQDRRDVQGAQPPRELEAVLVPRGLTGGFGGTGHNPVCLSVCLQSQH